MSYETQSFIWCYSVLLLRSLNPRPTEKWPCCGLLPVSPCAVIPLLGKGSSLTNSIPTDTQADEQQVHSQCDGKLNATNPPETSSTKHVAQSSFSGSPHHEKAIVTVKVGVWARSRWARKNQFFISHL